MYKVYFTDGRSDIIEVNDINEFIKAHPNVYSYVRVCCDTCGKCTVDTFECVTHNYIYWENKYGTN